MERGQHLGRSRAGSYAPSSGGMCEEIFETGSSKVGIPGWFVRWLYCQYGYCSGNRQLFIIVKKKIYSTNEKYLFMSADFSFLEKEN
jgi:hypothetical protein